MMLKASFHTTYAVFVGSFTIKSQMCDPGPQNQS